MFILSIFKIIFIYLIKKKNLKRGLTEMSIHFWLISLNYLFALFGFIYLILFCMKIIFQLVF